MVTFARHGLVLALFLLSLGTSALAQGTISTIAGTDWIFPNVSLAAVNAPVGRVVNVILDKNQNLIVADVDNFMVFRVNRNNGSIQTIVGNGSLFLSGDGGPAINAGFRLPYGMAFDANGNLFVASRDYNRIRMVTPDGTITTVAGGETGFSGDGGPAKQASLSAPQGLAVNAAGELYIADSGNNRIRRIRVNGTIDTIAGGAQAGFSGDNGPASSATLSTPAGLAFDSNGNLLIADSGNNRIRRISASGTITTVAGEGSAGFSGDGGPAVQAKLIQPAGVAVDGQGRILIADNGNHRIRRVNSDGRIESIAGTGTAGFAGDGGPATAAQLNLPYAMTVDSGGNIFVADYGNSRIRRIDTSGVIATVAGNGRFRLSADNIQAKTAILNTPTGLALDPSGNLYIAENQEARVRKVAPSGIITTVAGNGTPGLSGENVPAVSPSLYSPSRLAVDGNGNLYISDNAIHRIRRVGPNGNIVTIAGVGTGFSGDGGPATQATLNQPEGIALDASGNLYIADFLNNRIRKIDTRGIISTIAGNGTQGFSGDGGPALAAALYAPTGIAVDSAGNIFIAERYNHRIRKINGSGVISTVAGNGTGASTGDGGPAVQASLNQPGGVTVDGAGNIFIAELFGCRIRRVSPGGTITTVAGTGVGGFSGDGGPATQANLYIPSDVKVDAQGNLYIADAFSHRVRVVLAAPATFQTASGSLAFSATAGDVAPSPQPVNLQSTVTGLVFTAVTSASWLAATPSPGSMPATLQVSVDAGKLTPGDYQGTVTITAPGASPATAAVAVSLTVKPPVAAPALGVPTQALSLSGLQGAGTQSGSLQVTNTGGGSLAFTAAATTTSGGPWLSVTPVSGSATPGTPASLTVTAAIGSLNPGTYQGAIAITGAGQTINVPLTLSVAAPNRVILISQTAISFTAVAQGGMPLPQSFGILNTGQSSMDWSASASTISGGNWLRISPSSGTVDQPFTGVSLVAVAVDPTNLAPGDYYGRIQISAAAVNSPQVTSVILTVLAPGSYLGPEVRPLGLIFTGQAGVTPGSQDVLIGNPKGQPDSFLSGSIGKGFTYLPTNANVQPDQPATVRVYPDFSKLSPGEIDRGTITLQFSDGTPRTISTLILVAPSSSAGNKSGQREASSCGSPNLQIQVRSLRQNFAASLGQPTTVEAQVVDECGNLVGPGNPSGASVTAAFSNGDSGLQMTHIGGGIWTGTWRPVRPVATSQVTITITAFLAQGSSLQQNQVAIAGSLTAAGATPIVTAGGVVHAASGKVAPISPGSLITIYGSNLADGVSQAANLPLPQQQNGVQALLGDRPLPLLYTSTGQMNVQVPFDIPINTQYQVTVQRGSAQSVPEALVIAAAQPGIFTLNQSGTGQGAIVKSDGVTLARAGTPAVIGETIVIYCTGLGAVTPAVPTGASAPGSPLSRTVNAVAVQIGGRDAAVSFSGLTPGSAGLYQINAAVPAGIATGDTVPVVAIVAGQTSPAVTIAVR